MTLFAGRPTWASLSVDGKPPIGTPAVVRLAPGLHRLRLAREGFKSMERDVHLRAQQVVALRLELTP